MREVEKEKKLRWRWDWPAVSALGTCAGAIMSIGALGFSLYMLFTVHKDSQHAAQLDIRAKEIEHEARARIELDRESTNDVFKVVNYGKIPIEHAELFIRYYEIQGTNGTVVTNSYSDFGRFHPNDPQQVKFLSPIKFGPEPPLGFAMVLLQGSQTFMEKKPFQTEVFVWLFYQRREWVKESETLGNITNPKQRDILRNAIQEFRDKH